MLHHGHTEASCDGVRGSTHLRGVPEGLAFDTARDQLTGIPEGFALDAGSQKRRILCGPEKSFCRTQPKGPRNRNSL